MILGLLEDIHRMYDGLPARPAMPSDLPDAVEVPYLGEFERAVAKMDFSSLLDPHDEVDGILHGRKDMVMVGSTASTSFTYEGTTVAFLFLNFSICCSSRLGSSAVL